VLSDTRSIYTPLYSGVFWDVQDYLMADIDRIEVIRGPVAALWGSNAVNRVINIETRNAAHTQGAYVEAQAGNERSMLAGRYGGQMGNVAYRVFGTHAELNASLNPTSRQRGRCADDSSGISLRLGRRSRSLHGAGRCVSRTDRPVRAVDHDHWPAVSAGPIACRRERRQCIGALAASQ